MLLCTFLSILLKKCLYNLKNPHTIGFRRTIEIENIVEMTILLSIPNK